MPEWLRELLARQGSAGLVDTLAALVGAMPQFQQMPANIRNSQGVQVSAQAGYMPATGDYVLQLAPQVLRNFGRQGTSSGYQGYKAYDPKQTMGDRILAHEFGHLALIGSKNVPFAAQLDSVRQYDEERYADDFQNAIQFLRGQQTDSSALSEESRRLVDVLLRQPIYAEHPLNKAKAFGALTGSKR